MSPSQSIPEPRSRRHGFRGFWLEALGIATFITIGMTTLTWLVDQDSKGSTLQVLMYALSMPARIFIMFSGPEHYHDGTSDSVHFTACFLMTVQWVVVGAVIGLLTALVHRATRRA